MKEKLINIIKFVIILVFFFTLSSLLVLGIKNMGFAIIDYKDIVVISSATEVLLSVLIFALYGTDLIKDKTILKDNDIVKKIIKYFCMFWIIKILSSLVMAALCAVGGFDINISENQEAINLYTTSAPILMLLTTSITTPIVEEGIFRLGISKIIKNIITTFFNVTFRLLNISIPPIFS